MLGGVGGPAHDFALQFHNRLIAAGMKPGDALSAMETPHIDFDATPGEQSRKFPLNSQRGGDKDVDHFRAGFCGAKQLRAGTLGAAAQDGLQLSAARDHGNCVVDQKSGTVAERPEHRGSGTAAEVERPRRQQG